MCANMYYSTETGLYSKIVCICNLIKQCGVRHGLTTQYSRPLKDRKLEKKTQICGGTDLP